MTAELGLAALAAFAAALACASWLAQARSGKIFARRDSLALACWAAVSGLTQTLVVVRSDLPSEVSSVGYALASLFAIVGIAGTARAVVLTGALGSAVADSALVGSCVVAILWGFKGSTDPSAVVVLPLCLTIASASVCALVLRGVVASPSLVVDTRFRAQLLTAGVATAALTGFDAVTALAAAGVDVPAAVAPATAGVGYLFAAITPWVAMSAPRPGPDASMVLRTLPYALVAAAVLAQAVDAVRGGPGPITVALVALVVLCLLVVQALGLRENARLSSALEYSRARLAALVENAGDVILGLDGNGRVVAANAAALRLLHRAPEVLVGEDVAELAVLDERARVREAVRDVVRGRLASARAELTLAPPGTGTVELRLRGVPDGAVANLSDVTESVQLRERLARLARYDQMTGLANRAHLQEELGQWLDTGRPVSLLYVDLDGFKAVNDRFGHLAGDAVLGDVAARLGQAARMMTATRTLVARIGGDEFVVALLDVPLAAAVACAEKILASMRPTFSVADRAVRLGASVGVAATDDGSARTGGPAGAADQLHRADIAMFAAKESGRSRVVPWDDALEQRALRKVDIAIGLRRALDTGRLALAYQPIVRLSDGVIVAVEALIRLHRVDEHPGSLAGLADLVTPAELIAVAEDTGEIDEMGRWVLAEATAQASRWQQLGLDVVVNVNMSVRQLSDPGSVLAVRSALAAARLAPDRLMIEITEGQLLGEGHRAFDTIRSLRADGVQLAIDDFGSGYSSLAYLRRMPVRTVKIDKTLLDGVGTDPRATTLVRAVIGAARGLGLLVVCEGIEGLEMARRLRDLGAWAGQGFALHGAVTSSALLDVLQGPPVWLGQAAADERSGSHITRHVRDPI